MPFINSQDPGAPRVTVYIRCSLKTRALKIYSNLEVQLHFHSLTPHLRLAQSYMASRTTGKCPAETNLSSNLAFFFFPPNQIFRCHWFSRTVEENLQEGLFDMKVLLSCYILGRRARMERENSLMLWSCCHYPRDNILRWYGQALQITVI